MVILYLSTMLLCLDVECWPALAGVDTIPGDYPLELVEVELPEYGGDVLAYSETDVLIYSIHRTYPGREHLYSRSAINRRWITNGCINIEPYVYDRLVREEVDRLQIVP